jgi:hypothetical protein
MVVLLAVVCRVVVTLLVVVLFVVVLVVVGVAEAMSAKEAVVPVSTMQFCLLIIKIIRFLGQKS